MQTTKKPDYVLKRMAYFGAGLIFGPLAMYLALVLLTGQFSEINVRGINAVVYSSIALLILIRHPRHRIGWLFLVVGFFSMLSQVNGAVFLEFSGARDEVDVDRFASELLHTVQETIQPVRSSLWLKER